jgi:hypothetical protein
VMYAVAVNGRVQSEMGDNVWAVGSSVLWDRKGCFALYCVACALVVLYIEAPLMDATCRALERRQSWGTPASTHLCCCAALESLSPTEGLSWSCIRHVTAEVAVVSCGCAY